MIAVASSKDTKRLIRDLECQGWTIKLRKAGHYVAYPPDSSKPQVFFPSTPSDARSIKNTIAQLRKSGYEG